MDLDYARDTRNRWRHEVARLEPRKKALSGKYTIAVRTRDTLEWLVDKLEGNGQSKPPPRKRRGRPPKQTGTLPGEDTWHAKRAECISKTNIIPRNWEECRRLLAEHEGNAQIEGTDHAANG